jgi:hypothetical protein
VRTYTTCATCGNELEMEAEDNRSSTHATCPPATDRASVLTRRYLDALHHNELGAADRAAAELDALDDALPNLVGAALAYAGWGWPVLPLRPGRKTPATRHGLHDASTDPDQVRAWWTRWPEANIGLTTGVRFDVLDVDPAGLRWLGELRHVGGAELAVHGEVSTPRGGMHLYLPASGHGNLVGLACGVDYRGVGGYVVAPPSVLHPAALEPPVPPWPLRYTWWVRPSPTLTGTAGGTP